MKVTGCSPIPSLEETEIAAFGTFALENRLCTKYYNSAKRFCQGF